MVESAAKFGHLKSSAMFTGLSTQILITNVVLGFFGVAICLENLSAKSSAMRSTDHLSTMTKLASRSLAVVGYGAPVRTCIRQGSVLMCPKTRIAVTTADAEGSRYVGVRRRKFYGRSPNLTVPEWAELNTPLAFGQHVS